MAEISYRETTLRDIEFVAEHMRQADREEVYAAARKTPYEALMESFHKSLETVTVLSPDGVPLVIFGIVEGGLLSNKAVPWLLGCDEALKYRKKFLQEPGKVLEFWLEQYKMLENYVHVKNKISILWLKKLGFKMDEPVLFQGTGEHFIRFYMER